MINEKYSYNLVVSKCWGTFSTIKKKQQKAGSRPTLVTFVITHPEIESRLRRREMASVKPPQVSDKQMENEANLLYKKKKKEEATAMSSLFLDALLSSSVLSSFLVNLFFTAQPHEPHMLSFQGRLVFFHLV